MPWNLISSDRRKVLGELSVELGWITKQLADVIPNGMTHAAN